MDQQPSAAIDSSVPHSARFWNYLLGGKENYEVDRAIGDQVKAQFPRLVTVARESRAFLVRAVRYAVQEQGIRQFLDVGTGLPTADNTHEIAQRHAPDARIVYVDNDPLVLAHARALLASTPEGATWYLHADIREPESIVDMAGDLLDFSRPVGLILFGILGLIPEHDRAKSIVDTLLAPLPSGSHLALFDVDDTDPAAVDAARRYAETGAIPYNHRSPEQIAGYFDGLELLDPGVVRCGRWHADLPSEDTTTLAGLARKL